MQTHIAYELLFVNIDTFFPNLTFFALDRNKTVTLLRTCYYICTSFETMPPSKHKVKQKTSVNLRMFCIGCAFNKSGKTRGKNSFKGTFHRDKDIKFVSSGLTRHLFHRNYNNCLQHYKDIGLCSMDEENIDYSSSIVGRSPIDPLPTYQKKKLHC